MNAETSMRSLLERLVAFYSAKQAEDALKLFSEDATLVGTGSDEIRFGQRAIRQQIERDLSQAEMLKVTFDDLRVVDEGDVAWCFAIVTVGVTVDGEVVAMPMRLTATASMDGGEWRFRQAHFSLPAVAQEEGQSFTATEP
jgi:uncharacterized protein (TIGR02246 family)